MADIQENQKPVNTHLNKKTAAEATQAPYTEV